MKVGLLLRGGPYDFWGGGGGGLNNLFIFSQFGNNFFILPAVKNNFFSFVRTKDETIFATTYFCELTGHTVGFDDNMSNFSW